MPGSTGMYSVGAIVVAAPSPARDDHTVYNFYFAPAGAYMPVCYLMLMLALKLTSRAHLSEGAVLCSTL
jgi:hypothetical protein